MVAGMIRVGAAPIRRARKDATGSARWAAMWWSISTRSLPHCLDHGGARPKGTQDPIRWNPDVPRRCRIGGA
jgi:hypothetical protein